MNTTIRSLGMLPLLLLCLCSTSAHAQRAAPEVDLLGMGGVQAGDPVGRENTPVDLVRYLDLQGTLTSVTAAAATPTTATLVNGIALGSVCEHRDSPFPRSLGLEVGSQRFQMGISSANCMLSQDPDYPGPRMVAQYHLWMRQVHPSGAGTYRSAHMGVLDLVRTNDRVQQRRTWTLQGTLGGFQAHFDLPSTPWIVLPRPPERLP